MHLLPSAPICYRQSPSPEAPIGLEVWPVSLIGSDFYTSRALPSGGETYKKNLGQGYQWGHFDAEVSVAIWAIARAVVIDDHRK